ncbi:MULTISPECIES: phosphate ABC transporter permease subunit PstC [Haloferax]|uniref:Phosphate transport system permease protein n=1 Tax=Haloferax massiliensis TaxID=1476858 RepID=A0A0D6JW69_9EURY|nr:MULTISPECIES: phosphate ABC transporter permease subunit PstC [Haloferax]MDS0242475.1 phosphate ABC transporter permease subunit PstC [Haloferax sp. S2CR25]MDS0445596.1 phosphate ABC transporter permease subunit PstC [Haloferax sp. S2CR25-2]CQR52886.1 Phosphate transport system permease protein PstC [Haloferax massiliensis]
MNVLPDSDGAGLRAAARRGLRRGRDFVDETPPGALVTVAVAAVSLLAAFAGFLAVSSLTAVPFAVFLVATGYGWLRHQELTARVLTLTTTVSTILVLGLILVFIFAEAWPTVQYATVNVFGVPIPGLRLFIETRWSPVTPPIRYSLVPMIHGTVLVTIIATAVAAPLGVAAALFLSEIAPRTVREVVKPGVEILAGIPSIVYGFIGFTILSPWAADQFDILGQGTYLFVGIVVGLMALPTVVSVAEDALNSVPESMKSGSLALGTTDWQTMTSITLPAAFSGVSAAVLLGVGRAIGETMAATVMLRGSPKLTKPLYNVFYGNDTLTSLIAANYGDADGLQLSALFVAGVILFVTVLFLSIGSQYIEARMRRKLGGAD